MVLKVNITEHWSVQGELDLRFTDLKTSREQLIVRPMVLYKMSNSLVVGGGYTFVETNTYLENLRPINRQEYNILQQLLWSHKIPKSNFSHRIRLEERFIDKIVIEENNPVLDGTSYITRFRYRGTLLIPIMTLKNAVNLSFVTYDELFVKLNNGKSINGLEQNWLFVGLNLKLNEKCSIQSGYTNSNSHPNTNLALTKHVWQSYLIYQLF